MRAALLLLVALSACGSGRSKADCGIPEDPGPMSPARAAILAPEISTGLALSTAWIRGDCRPRPPDSAPTDDCGDGLCLNSRAALRVLVVPADVSVPLAPACAGAPLADALVSAAVVDAESSPQGELVVELPPGLYSPYLVGRGGCAPCGDPGGGACAVLVTDGAVATRDLVLDEAAH
ncbi:MAG: hypothetical protein KC933_15760 [Myxococcales bacterium]|nr:hypothetical protein [Myxococcales bacterium]